jgi:error-prone DNA polymerase
MGDYVELHCHSAFSFREGASTPLELVLQARQLGYTGLALTDHNGLAGAMEFVLTAKEWELQPIIGAEITLRPSSPTPLPKGEGSSYHTVNNGHARGPQRSSEISFAPLRMTQRSPRKTQVSHLTLIASTARGYANLSRLLSEALLSSPRDEPSLDPAALEGKTEGLIALSGCAQGEVPSRIARYDVADARRMTERYIELFGRESFFIELQNNLVYGDTMRNRGLVDLARELGLGIVATNNVHYHARERHRLQDVLVAVRHRTTLDASERVRRKNAEFYLKSPEQMAALFAELPEALRNTVAIAERCVFDLTKDLTYVFPDFEAPDGKSADDYLEEVCRAAALELYG